MSTPTETMNARPDAADVLRLHAEATCAVPAQASSVFKYIDHSQRLSAHMARRSWQLAGASMTIETDAEGGRAVGSHIRLAGRMLGIPLYVEGKVVQRQPPNLKAWETACIFLAAQDRKAIKESSPVAIRLLAVDLYQRPKFKGPILQES